jgi:hypothetical protein
LKGGIVDASKEKSKKARQEKGGEEKTPLALNAS